MESARCPSPRGLLPDAAGKSALDLKELGLDLSSYFLILTGIAGSALEFVLLGRPAGAKRLGFSDIGFVVRLFLMALLN